MTLTPRSCPAEWLERDGGAATRQEIIDRFTHHAFRTSLHAKAIARILPDIYVAQRCASDFMVRARAALAWAGPSAALGGESAIHLHGLTERPPLGITLYAPPTARLRAPDWITVIQPGVVGPVTKARGLRAVPLVDALLQVWTARGREGGASLMLGAIRGERITAREIATRAREYPRLRDRRALARLLDPLADGVQSYLEHLAATRVFTTADFAGLRRQVRVPAGGHVRVLDLYDAEARVAVELDGRRFHGDDAARRRDLARDTELASIGIQTVRLTYEDITLRPAWCRDRVRRALVARRRRRAA